MACGSSRRAGSTRSGMPARPPWRVSRRGCGDIATSDAAAYPVALSAALERLAATVAAELTSTSDTGF